MSGELWRRGDAFGHTLRKAFPGLMLCGVLTAAAAFLSEHHGGPVILYALLLGMAFHFLVDDPRLQPGLMFAAQTVLRVGVALLGARITTAQIAAVGLPMMLAIVGAVIATIAFGVLAAQYLGLQRRFGILTAGATAICGASAAAAISSVLPRHPETERDTAFTIIGVTTLSTVAMVTYPILARWLGFDDKATGIFIGATIHDVAQVVGAGYSVSALAGDKATIVKLFRVALLLPIVVAIAWGTRVHSGSSGSSRGNLLPGFLVAFAALVAINSIGLIPDAVGKALSQTSRWCIVVSIAAVGVRTSLKSFSDVGQPAIGMLVVQTVFLAALVALIVFFVP